MKIIATPQGITVVGQPRQTQLPVDNTMAEVVEDLIKTKPYVITGEAIQFPNKVKPQDDR